MTKRTPAGTPAGGQFTAPVRSEADVLLATTSEPWRDQTVVVEGRSFTLGDVYGGRLFHGSPHPLDDGAVLEPGRAEANFAESDAGSVSITSGADIARHWAREAAGDKGEFYVYEVEPDGPVQVWRAMLANYGQSVRLQEGRVASARVVRRVPLDVARNYEVALMRGEDPLPQVP